MEKLKELICEWKRKKQERRKENIRIRANEIYQITEFCGKLWFTCNGFLFCPCDLVKEDPIDALNELRSWYVSRNCLV